MVPYYLEKHLTKITEKDDVTIATLVSSTGNTNLEIYYFGELIENGDYPANIEFVGQIVQDICYNNAKEFFFKEEK